MKNLRHLPLLTVTLLLLITVLFITACGEPAATTDSGEVTTTPEATTIAEITTTVPETTEAGPEWVNAVFGGGPFTTGGVTVANVLKETDFNTLMLWSVHVQENGDLYMNDILVVKDGELATKSTSRTWDYIRRLCPNITRIEISVGAWGTPDFENIKKLIDRDGTGKDTILYKNFKALIDATQADAVNFDDESLYDVDAMSKFGKMCIEMGTKVTFCPYRSMDFWFNLYKAIGTEHVDRIYVQHYDGGAGNNPIDWARKFGCDIIPGYWCLNGNEAATKGKKTAAEVEAHLKQNQKFCEGGFMWLFDEMLANGTSKDYAAAIEAAGEGKEWKNK